MTFDLRQKRCERHAEVAHVDQVEVRAPAFAAPLIVRELAAVGAADWHDGVVTNRDTRLRSK